MDLESNSTKKEELESFLESQNKSGENDLETELERMSILQPIPVNSFPLDYEIQYYENNAISKPEKQIDSLQVFSSDHHNIYVEEKVEVVLYGSPLIYTFLEFEKHSNKISNELLKEAYYMSSSLMSTYDIYMDLHDEQSIVSWTVRFFSRVNLDNIKRLKKLAEQTNAISDRISGPQIDVHDIFKAGLELMQIRKEEKELLVQIKKETDKTITTASTIEKSFEITEDVSFEVLKGAAKISTLNSPIRRAMYEIGILLLRSSAESLGNYIAYKDKEHVLEALRVTFEKEVPPMFSEIMLDGLSKYYPKDIPKLQKFIVESIVKAEINFIFDFIKEAIKEGGKIDEKFVLDAMINALEMALQDIISELLGHKSESKGNLVKEISFIILSGILEVAIGIYADALKESREKKAGMLEILISKLPEFSIAILKKILSGIINLLVKYQYEENRSIHDLWLVEKKRIRTILEKLKQKPDQQDSYPKDGQAKLPLKPKENSHAVVITAKLNNDSKNQTDSALNQEQPGADVISMVPRIKNQPGTQPKRKILGMPIFTAGGHSVSEYAKTENGKKVIPLLRNEIEKSLNISQKKNTSKEKPYIDEKNDTEMVDRALKAYVESAKGEIHVSETHGGEEYFKILSSKQREKFFDEYDKPNSTYWSGFWLTKKQLEIIKANPMAVNHVLLALPGTSTTVEYEVIKVKAKPKAVVFKSEVAYAVDMYHTIHEEDGKQFVESHKVIHLGGEGTTRGKDPESDKDVNIKTEQAILPNRNSFERPELIDETIKIKPENEKTFINEIYSENSINR